MSFLGILRIVCFVLASVIAVVVVALGAQITSIAETDTNSYAKFAILAIVTAALTIFTLPVFLIVDKMRKGAVTSMILVEMITLTILWALWIATAAYINHVFQNLTNCSIFNTVPIYEEYLPNFATACQEGMAIEGISFLAWVILMVYSFTLLVFTFIAGARGHNVWFSSVHDTNFFAPAVTAEPQSAPQPNPYMSGMPQMPQPGMHPYPTGMPQMQQPGMHPMYPSYQPGTPMPQGAPMQQVVQGGPFMTPQSTGTPYQLPTTPTPPPQQQGPYAQV